LRATSEILSYPLFRGCLIIVITFLPLLGSCFPPPFPRQHSHDDAFLPLFSPYPFTVKEARHRSFFFPFMIFVPFLSRCRVGIVPSPFPLPRLIDKSLLRSLLPFLSEPYDECDNRSSFPFRVIDAAGMLLLSLPSPWLFLLLSVAGRTVRSFSSFFFWSAIENRKTNSLLFLKQKKKNPRQ